MKRFLALAALVLGLAACQTEPEGLDVIVGGEVDTVVSVSLPEATRAGVDSAVGFDLTTLESSDYSLRYILEIYLGENCQRHVLVSDATSVAFPVRLAPGRDYTFVAWADIVEEKKANGDVKTEDELKADRYYNTQDGLDNISIVDNTWNAMDESRDAFTAKEARTGFSAQAVDLHLKRPFAKLRVVATDREDVVNLGLTPHTTVVKYSQAMPTAFDASTGQPIANSAIENKSHTVTYTTDVYKYENNEYTLFADYFFVPSTGTAKFEFNVYADAEQKNLIKGTNFNTDIFVEANKLTTIKGDVLTTGGNVSIKIENDLGVKETYTYITSAAALLKAMNSVGNFVLGHDITVSEADIAAANRLAATRTTSKKTVIDLNDKTITIDNRSTNNQPLVTLEEGNTLVFAGEGDIVMTAESTAPFVNTKTNDANVIIEQATVTNQSTKQGAAVVDGDAIVNAAANVDADAVSGDVKPQLEYVLANGGEVTLFEDVTSDKNLEISATNPVVINGNGNTITFTDNVNANRGFRIMSANTVTFKDATIVNDVNGGRCIETRTGNINLTLNNVNLTATQTGSQPFTVGGTGIDVTVNINNSTINAGKGYGITTFNPTTLTINNSTVTGYAALNIKAASGSEGSAGSVINVTGSTLAGVNNWPGESNAFSTIMLEDSDVTINIDSTSTVKVIATSNDHSALCFGNETVESVVSGCDITIAGNIVMDGDKARLVYCSKTQCGIGNNSVKFADEYADALETEGWIVGEPTDGLVTIAEEVAKIGSEVYFSLQAAIEAVQDGETIVLQRDVNIATPAYGQNALNHARAINFTLDLNGKTITANTGNSVFRYNISQTDATSDITVTFKNGTVTAGDNTWCAVMASGISNSAKAVFNLENMTINSSKANDYAVKAWSNSVINATNVTVNATKCAGGFYAPGGEIVLTNCAVNQKGLYTSPYMSMAIGVSSNGKATVNSGNYTTEPTTASEGSNQGTSHGSWCAGVMNSGGELIINGGTFANGNFGDDALATYARGLIFGDTASKIVINDGTFNALKTIIDYQNNLGVQPNPNIVINGGNFSANPAVVTSYGGVVLAEGKVAAQGADGRWTLVDGVMDEAGLKAAFEKGGNIVLGADITLSETVTLAEGKTAVLNLNGKTLSVADKNVIRNDGGNLTIKNGTVTRTGDAVGYSVNNASGEITVENATIKRGLYTSGSKMTATDANISHEQSSRHTIYAWDCEVTINSGTYHNDNAGNATLMASGSSVVTINGGTFSIADGRSSLGWTSCMLDSQNSAKVIINDGTYNGGFRVQAGTSMTINGGSFNDCYGSNYNIYGTVTVKGGTYTDDVAKAFAKKYIADGYETNANGEVVAK